MPSVQDAAANVALLAAARAVAPHATADDDAELVVSGALASMDAQQRREAALFVARTRIFCQRAVERATELAAGGEVTEEHVRQAAAECKDS